MTNEIPSRHPHAPTTGATLFKSRLATIKRSRRFIRWGESAAFAHELSALLAELDADVTDPRCGCDLVAAFFRADRATLGRCDDSSGHLGDVFRLEAAGLFAAYARRCPDKEWLADLVFELNRDDDFGVRDHVLESAAEYLPEPLVRDLIRRFLAEAARYPTGDFAGHHWSRLAETLARQLSDAPLFEQIRRASWGVSSVASRLDIGRVYLESGDARTALSWCEQVPVSEHFQQDERDALLLAALTQLGNQPRREEVAWRIFRRARGKLELAALLAVIGEDRQATVIEAETTAILATPGLSHTDTAFLIEVGRLDAAERYLLDRAALLDGDYYDRLLPLAEAMEACLRPVAASLIYRALLDSILRRARSTIYGHGVRYLRKLDLLATVVTDWRRQPGHDAYLAALRLAHGRKSSFWGRYGEGAG